MDRLLAIFGSIWCAIVVLGLVVLTQHAQRAGASGDPPSSWPVEVALDRTAGRPTLILALHPECPCSQATASELERLMVHRADQVDVRALFVRPRGVTSDPRTTVLWQRVVAIPGVSAQIDESGTIAARFGALTSGQVVLYDAAGALQFAGGITGSRGHEGDNAGRDAVEALLDRRGASPRAPVFGCALFAEKN